MGLETAETTETPSSINCTVVDSDPTGDSGTMLTAAIAFFACGSVLFVTSLVFWVMYCMRRRSKGHPFRGVQPSVRSSAPSRSTLKRAESRGLEYSGRYVGYDASLDASIHMYDAIQSDPSRHHQAYPPVSEVPQGEFEETFDGSRMPPYKAPAVPPQDYVVSGNDRKITETSTIHLEATGMEKRHRYSSNSQHAYDDANMGESRSEDAVADTDYDVVESDMRPDDTDQGELTMSFEEQTAPPLPARRSIPS